MKLSIYNSNRKMPDSSVFIKRSILLGYLILCCFTGSVFSQTSLKGSQIVENATITAPLDETVGLVNTRISNPEAYIRLRVDDDLHHNESFKYTVTIEVTPLLADGSQDVPYNQELTIFYNINGEVSPYEDLTYHRLGNRYGVSVKVISLEILKPDTNTPITTIPENIVLETRFIADVHHKLSEQSPIVNTHQISENRLLFIWDKITGAREYELEWTWIDNYGVNQNGNADLSVRKQPSEIKLTERDFELNSTRVQTELNFYEIPLIYARGYLVYRVRAIGRFSTDYIKRYYGSWSNSDTSKATVANWEYKVIEAHEHNKNWQFQASYAEGGKRKEVVSYFDGTLRNRQTVTKINTDDRPIVGEVIYDTQGRPAIEVLPTPVAISDGNEIKYYNNFNKVDSNTPYTHRNFDWQKTEEQQCKIEAVGMTTQSGASRYYSPNGDQNVSKPYQEFVPDAQQFPFSQIEYTPDNTGRIARKSGVGPTHRLGEGHEMKYYYLQPSQEELNRLFGYNVGDKKRYKKNMVVDPNGQVSISYIDPQGRTIATALAGTAPDGMTALADQGNSTDDMVFDLINKADQNDVKKPEDNNEYISTGRFGVDVTDGLSVSYPLGVSEADKTYQFNYEMGAINKYVDDCIPEAYDFKYDLEITLQNDCNDNMFEADQEIKEEGIIGYAPKSIPTKKLDIGSYQLNKRITVNEAAVNQYVEQYIGEYTCLLNLEDFEPNVSIDDCFTSCQDCVNNLLNEVDNYNTLFPAESELTAPRQQYVLEQISQIMGNDTFYYEGGILKNAPLDEGISEDEEIVFYAQKDLYEERFKKEFDLLLQACQAPCKVVSICDVNELALLADVSPSGQYGTTTQEDSFDDEVATEEERKAIEELSVFNENNVLGENQNWKNPDTPYIDAYGDISKIYINDSNSYEYTGDSIIDTITGQEYILPQQLVNIDDFLSLWQSSWAQSLVAYHPEYCYLDYYNELCARTFNVGGIDMNTDTYDDFVINTIKKAQDAKGGNSTFTINFLENINSLIDKDPYFKTTYTNAIDGTIGGRNAKTVRTAIMNEALTSNYSTILDEQDNQEKEVSMLKMAYITIVYGNDIQGNIDVNGLPSEDDILSILQVEGVSNIDNRQLAQSQKDRIWETYKYYYVGLKKKIINVFSNIYAKKEGCYNGCIGKDGNPEVVTVLQDFSQFSQLSQMFNAGTANELCSGEAVQYLKDVEKKFAPIDNIYDSGVPTNDAITDLAEETDFQIWTQTGKCPLAYDMEYFLNGLASEGKLVSGVNIGSITYLVPDLYNKIITEVPTNTNITVTGNIQNNNQTLDIALDGVASCNTSLTLPSGINWNNYKGEGTAGWQLVSLTNLSYIPDSFSNGTFSFTVLARVIPDGTTAPTDIDNQDLPIGMVEEYVITGVTCVPIGECKVEDDVRPIGEVLSDQVSTDGGNGCRKRDKFERSLIRLMNELNQKNKLSNAPLSVEDSYTEGIMPLILGDYGNIGIWKSTSNGFSISDPSDNVILSIQDIGTSIIWEEVNSYLSFKIKEDTNFTMRLIDQNHEIQELQGQIYTSANNTGTLDFNCGCNNEQIFSRNDYLIDKLNIVINKVHNSFDELPEGYVPDALDELAQYLSLPSGSTIGIYDKRKEEGYYSYYLAQDISGFPTYQVKVNGTNLFGLQHISLYKSNLQFDQETLAIRATALPITTEEASITNIELNGTSFCKSGELVIRDTVSDQGNGSSTCTSIDASRNTLFTTVMKEIARGIGAGGSNGELITEHMDDFFYYYNDRPYLIDYNEEYNSLTNWTRVSFKITDGTIGVGELPKCIIEFSSYGNPNNIESNIDNLGKGLYFFTTPSSEFDQANAFRTQNNQGNDLITGTMRCPACSDWTNNDPDPIVACPVENATPGTDTRTQEFLNLINAVREAERSGVGANGLVSQPITTFFEGIYDNPRIANYSQSSVDGITTVNYDIINGRGGEDCHVYYAVNETINASVNPLDAVQFDTVATISGSISEFTLLRNVQGGGYASIGEGGINCPLCSEVGPNPSDTNCDPIVICEQEELCIPPTVPAVACNEKYQDFINTIRIQVVDYQIPFYFLNDDTATEEIDRYKGIDYFCKLNYGYITDSYLEYLRQMSITSTEDDNFLSIGGFGATDLNYGYADIEAVIIDFKEYKENELNTYGWQQFVDEIYMSTHDVCPPVPLPVVIDIDLDPNSENEECQRYLEDITGTYSEDEYDAYKTRLKNTFRQKYIKGAIDNLVEKFTMIAPDREYQYTLYYYDQAGNLVQTVPPEGVERPTDDLDKNAQLQYHTDVNKDRTALYHDTDEVNSQLPEHRLETQYKYNSLNQLIWQKTPDGGITRFAYDKLGRIIASQNAKQQQLDNGQRFSYTRYDALGRITEAGEFIANTPIYIDDFGKLKTSGSNTIEGVTSYPDQITTIKTEVTKTIYDELLTTEVSNLFEIYDSSTTRNRVTAVLYFDTYSGDDLAYQNAIFYNYDIHGNVKELIVDNRDPEMVAINQNIKHVSYEYDLISGNVNKVLFQEGKPDQFIHKYTYDADNRITSVETSTDGVIWEQDATYEYYAHGPLARTIIGDKEVQGMDYAYTLQGWLKGVNSETVGQNDIGKDGGTFNRVAKDAMAYSLNYYNGDYKATHTSSPFTIAETGSNINNANLYNGNIKTMVTSLLDNKENALSVLQNNYTYDQLNRIKEMKGYENGGAVGYSATYTYDNNGNLTNLSRTDQTGTLIDNFTYKYRKDDNGDIVNNQLLTVQDTEGKKLDNDLLDQFAALGVPEDAFDQNKEEHINYVYDEIGQLIEDKTEGLHIDWRVDGKVKSVTKGDGTIITFTYDGLGNRIGKIEDRPDTTVNGETKDNITKTLYSRDAQGNVLAVYGTSTQGLDTESCDIDLFLNGITVSGEEKEEALETITVSNTDFYTITETGKVTMTAGDGITLKPGFQAKTGSDVKVGIATVDCEPVQEDVVMGLGLQEHHIYGSSRLGIQESDLILGDPTAPQTLRLVESTQDSFTKSSAPIASLSSSSLLSGDYALNFSKGNTVSGVWTDSYWFNKPPDDGTISYQLSIKLNVIDAPIEEEQHIVSTNGKYFLDINNQDGKVLDLRVSLSVIKRSDGLFYFEVRTKTQEVGKTIGYTDIIQSVTGFTSGSKDIIVRFDPETNLIQLFVNDRLIPVNLIINQNLFNAAQGHLEGQDNIISNQNPNVDEQTINFNVCYLAYGTIRNSTFSSTTFNFSEGVGGTVTSDSGGESIRLVNFDSSDAWIPGGCPTIDADNDGIVDTDEYDADGDGTGDQNNPDDTDNDGIPNYLDPDDDNDGVLTFDEVEGTDDNIPNHLDTDDDNDGILTINELATEDTDSDGTLNYLDADDDGDGIFTIFEGAIANTDQDTLPNYLDKDDDGDGVYTLYEGANPDGDGNPSTGGTLNTDGDSFPDYLDIDDDNDGYATFEEKPDPNGDGNPADAVNTDATEDTIPDYLDDTHSILPDTQPLVKTEFTRVVGDKRYELSNHLGNVLSVVSDRKLVDIQNNSIFTPDVLTFSDYYPGGMLLPNRHGNSSDYRYGFQGQEMDNEIKGEGNSLNYKFRMHDPRINRFFATDPLQHRYSYNSPYAFAENKLIMFPELEGLEIPSSYALFKKNTSTGEKMVVGVVVGTYNTGKGTWEFVSKEAWKRSTWSAFGNLLIGLAAHAGDATGISAHARMMQIDDRFGTQSFQTYTNAAQAIDQAIDQKIVNGDAFTRTAVATEVVLGILGGKGADKIRIIGRIKFFGLPQGVSKAKFLSISNKLKNLVGNVSDDIVVQGSRASGNARTIVNKSDIDIAIKVDADKFDEMVEQSFGKPNALSAKEKTKIHAITTGKITTGDANKVIKGLRTLKKELEQLLGMKVDLSIIKKGGSFDNGSQLPIK